MSNPHQRYDGHGLRPPSVDECHRFKLLMETAFAKKSLKNVPTENKTKNVFLRLKKIFFFLHHSTKIQLKEVSDNAPEKGNSLA